MRRVFAGVAALLFMCAMPGRLLAGADDEWQRIEALESAPGEKFTSREEARVVALRRLAKQESALRAFSAAHPEDARSLDAQLRLARVLAVRGDLEPSTEASAASRAILAKLEKTAPAERRADVAFARISLRMRNFATADSAARESLLSQARSFQRGFPGDRRIAALLTEVSTLFDDAPEMKGALLREASRLTTDPELTGRIADDMERLAMLGKPLAMRFPPESGRGFDVAHYRGKLVVICWFADWSPPAMLAVRGVRDALAGFSRNQVQPIGISLDHDRTVLARNMESLKLDWPVAFDGKGWESPLARDYRINALPTVWVLDREGKLRTLNVPGNLGAVLERMLRER
jgi:peroxiredoxin